MYQYLNLHPKEKRVGDCAKRAIAKAENRDYREVSLELNRLKKKSGALYYNDDRNLKHYFIVKKYQKLSFPAHAGEKRMTPQQFSEEYPKGSYILWMANHVTCCVDGVIYDIWDCTGKCIYNAWKVRG